MARFCNPGHSDSHCPALECQQQSADGLLSFLPLFGTCYTVLTCVFDSMLVVLSSSESLMDFSLWVLVKC